MPNSTRVLHLAWDEWTAEGYFYTQYDIGDEGHAIVIRTQDREAFLSAFADTCRKRADRLLEDWTDEWEAGD